MLSTLLLNRTKTTSKLYCALLVTLSLYYQVKKYMFMATAVRYPAKHGPPGPPWIYSWGESILAPLLDGQLTFSSSILSTKILMKIKNKKIIKYITPPLRTQKLQLIKIKQVRLRKLN